jgi:hypothetical protein
MLTVEPDELRAAASRWRTISAALADGGSPPVALERSWPSAAATDNIHAQSAAATGAFQTRIAGNAATSNNSANAFQTHEAMKAGDIKDVMSLVTSPLHDVISIAGSLGSTGSSIAGTVAQLGGQAVSVSSNIANTLTSALSHTGGSPQTPAGPVLADHGLSHEVASSPQTSTTPAPPTDRPQSPPESAQPDQHLISI